MTDTGLKELAALTQLQTLDLSQTSVTDAGLHELAGLKELIRLILSETRVTDAGLTELAGLQQLQTLELSFTKMTDAGLKEFAGPHPVGNFEARPYECSGRGFEGPGRTAAPARTGSVENEGDGRGPEATGVAEISCTTWTLASQR